MKRYKVTLTKKATATVEVQAESEKEAVEEAYSRLEQGEIELDDGLYYDNYTEVVEEIPQSPKESEVQDEHHPQS